MLRWQKERNPKTCEMVHVMYDDSTKVATVRNVHRGTRHFEVQICDSMPWHRRNLTSAKGDCEFVYLNTHKSRKKISGYSSAW